MEERICRELGGMKNMKWVYREATGRAGGILTIWDDEKLSVRSWWHIQGALVGNGVWGDGGCECCLVNIYALCDARGKVELWNQIRMVVDQSTDSCICVGGNFNAIRGNFERAGRSEVQINAEMMKFDRFITNCNLLDLPLHGRKYTCYRENDTCKSRIDRVLINEKWMDKWLGVYLRGLKRGLSNNCPLIVDIKQTDWEPKPFRSLHAWTKHPGFKTFIAKKWLSCNISGWEVFVIKEKLKLLRGDLKRWNENVFGCLNKKVEERKKEDSDSGYVR